MTRTKSILLGLLAVLLLAGVVAALNITSRSKEKWVGTDAQTEFREGPFYGLQVLLQSYDGTQQTDIRNERRLEGFERADGGQQLMIVSRHELESREDAQSLLAWVARGNHLVMPFYGARGDDADSFERVLADALRLSGEAAKELPDSENKQAAEVATVPACVDLLARQDAAAGKVGHPVEMTEARKANLRTCSFYVSEIRLPEGKTLFLNGGYDWGYAYHSYQPQNGSSVLFQGKSQSGTHIIRLRHGNGSIVLSNQTDWLENPEAPDEANNGLTVFDHAYLATYLAQDKERIWLVRNLVSAKQPLKEPMWLEMLKAQPVVVVLLLLGVMVLVWRIVARVGLVRQLPPAPERYLNQHLLAQGQFLSRHLSRTAILNDLQRQLLEQLQKRHPVWRQLSPDKQLDLLCRESQLPPQVVEPWLKPMPERLSMMQWLTLLRSHQRISRKIGSSWY